MYLNICQISLFSTTAKNLMESLQKDELEKEQSLNRELHSRLMEKENQLNISERQNEKLRRQNATINTLVKIQDEQIFCILNCQTLDQLRSDVSAVLEIS